MFIEPNNSPSIGPALTTAIGAVIAAAFASAVALVSNRQSSSNANDIESLKGAINRDLERLKSKLEHGHLVTSTQWNAEFSAYQALWKSVVPVRTIAVKLVQREGELTEIGLERGDVSESVRIETLKNVLQNYATKSSECVAAINDHAPFYAADIRKKANYAHARAHQIFKTNLALLVARQKGQLSSADDQAKRDKELDDLILGTNALEEAIRNRMSDVQVLHPSAM